MTLPTPCSEFIEALRSKLGVEERASILIELGLRGGGRDDALPFGDAVRCLKDLGDAESGERGTDSALDGRSPIRGGGLVSPIEKRLRESLKAADLFVDDGEDMVVI